MTKRTWRWPLLRGEAADVMATAPSYRAAAKALGVNLSTVVRWRQQGKIPSPGRPRGPRPRVVALAGAEPPTGPSALPLLSAGAATPEGFATWAHQTFELSGPEVALVDLAVRALTLARDDQQPPAIRLNAASRFQSLVRQLDFEEESHGQEATPRQWAGLGNNQPHRLR